MKLRICLCIFSEVEDLERSHAYLTDLVERQCIPVFQDIDTALQCTRKAIKEVNISLLHYLSPSLPHSLSFSPVSLCLYVVSERHHVFLLFQNVRVCDLTVDDGAQQVKHPHIRVVDKFL